MGVGLHVIERACEELCREGAMQRGHKVSELIQEITYFMYINKPVTQS